MEDEGWSGRDACWEVSSGGCFSDAVEDEDGRLTSVTGGTACHLRLRD